MLRAAFKVPFSICVDDSCEFITYCVVANQVDASVVPTLLCLTYCVDWRAVVPIVLRVEVSYDLEVVWRLEVVNTVIKFVLVSRDVLGANDVVCMVEGNVDLALIIAL